MRIHIFSSQRMNQQLMSQRVRVRTVGANIHRVIRYAVLSIWSAIGLVGCSLSDLVEVDTPTDQIMPTQISTVAGALGLYSGTIGLLNSVYGARFGDVVLAGVLTDEFQDTTASMRKIDTRSLISDNTTAHVYTGLQRVRTQGLQAIAAMRQFPEQIPASLVGRVYALVGYAELLLAERFCSGVPLSVIPPGGGEIMYSAGVPTPELFVRAVAHFDTALVLIGTDSLRFRSLSQVGKGRALLGLNRYDEASAAVASVLTEFVYHAEFSVADTNAVRPQTGSTVFTSSTREGGNGIDWLAAQDPRVPIRDTVKGFVRTSKYATATSPIVIADGIEARLIEAEALLADENPTWLTILNTLRARLTLPGGGRALADTTDPGTPEGRVDLLFRERAFWLYATGHRHGDLRRLVRQYKRNVNTVFPSGPYTPKFYNAPPVYGVQVAVPLPGQANPFFTGCLDTDA